MADHTASGRIVKTQRVMHTVTSPEATAGDGTIDIVWDTPFADLNYTVAVSDEVISGATTPIIYGVGGFERDVNKVTVHFGCGDAGAVIVLHAIAIHD